MRALLLITLIFTYISCSKDEIKTSNKKSNSTDSTHEAITPTKLVFTSNLEQAIASEVLLSDGIVIQAQDDDGNLASSFNGTITLAIATDPSSGSANLAGTLTSEAVNGIATFSDVSLDIINSGYTLIASTTGLTSAISNSFNIVKWAIQYGANTTIQNPIIESASNSGDDRCERGHIDSKGFIYCAGRTMGNLIDTNAGSGTFDAFVIKYNIKTREEVAAFQLGASAENLAIINDLSGDERVKGIEVDSQGNVYLSGTTNSAMTEANGGQDIFVIKLDSNLENIIWVKHFGQTTTLMPCPEGFSCSNAYTDAVENSTMDADGNLYLGGYTDSEIYNDTRHPNTYDEMLVFKMNADGEVQWVFHPTRNLENSNDQIYDLEVFQGHVYFAGNSGGFWIETPGAQPDGWSGQRDVMYGKIDASDGSEVWLQQLNTPDEGSNGILSTAFFENIEFMDMDSSGNLYMTGVARSAFGKPRVTDASNNYHDIIVVKVEPTAGAVQWTYHLGGDPGDSNFPNPNVSYDRTEYPAGIKLDQTGNVNVLFRSKSNNFISSTANTYDGFLLRLDSDGTPIGDNLGVSQFNGYDGSSAGDDLFFDFDIDSDNNFFVFGFTNGNYVETKSGGTWDVMLFRLDVN